MLVKLSVGIGDFGKLWTGTQLRPAHEDPKNSLWDFAANEAIPNIVDAMIVERRCECGASTRKFRATAVQQSAEARRALPHLPECFITAGGVGSIVSHPVTEGDTVSPEITVHNWSGRQGGHVILNPVMVLSGYVSREDLPAPKAGYGWVCTYSGSTLSEYVLLPATAGTETTFGPLGWGLPTVKLSGECPPCRQKREEAEAEAPQQVPITLASDGQYTLVFSSGHYKAGCRDFDSRDAALAHWSGDGERAKIFAEAIRNFVEPAIEQALIAVETPRRERRERGERGERGERRRRSEVPVSDFSALFEINEKPA